MSMTKKDFIALADEMRQALRGSIPAEEYRVDIQRQRVIEALMSFCKRQNPAFMEDRWMDYLKGECGPNGGKVKP